MNYRSLGIAAVVAWIVDSVYGYVVFGVLLNSEFARYPGVFRSTETVNSMLPIMFSASLVGMLLLAYIFAKGYEGGPGLQEGARFGVVFGLFLVFAMSIPQYVVYSYGGKLAAETAVGGFIEMVIVGIVLGLLYKPAASAARRSAAV